MVQARTIFLALPVGTAARGFLEAVVGMVFLLCPAQRFTAPRRQASIIRIRPPRHGSNTYAGQHLTHSPRSRRACAGGYRKMNCPPNGSWNRIGASAGREA